MIFIIMVCCILLTLPFWIFLVQAGIMALLTALAVVGCVMLVMSLPDRAMEIVSVGVLVTFLAFLLYCIVKTMFDYARMAYCWWHGLPYEEMTIIERLSK